jgi:hypothetical protein
MPTAVAQVEPSGKMIAAEMPGTLSDVRRALSSAFSWLVSCSAWVPVGVAGGVGVGLPVGGAIGLAVGLASCVLIGLALADATRVGAKVGVDEAPAVGVGALVQAAKNAARTNESHRGNEFTASEL